MAELAMGAPAAGAPAELEPPAARAAELQGELELHLQPEADADADADIDADIDALLAAGAELDLEHEGSESNGEPELPFDDEEWLGLGAEQLPSDADLLQQSVHQSGCVSMYSDAKMRQPRLERAQAQKELTNLKASFNELETAESAAQRAEDRARERLALLSSERDVLLAQLQEIEMEGATKPNTVQLQMLRQRVGSVAEDVRRQELALHEATAAARAAELNTDKRRLEIKRSIARLQAHSMPHAHPS